MVLLFGNKGYHDTLGYIINKCPECHMNVPFAVEQQRQKFTVFFIPTFQLSKKQYMVCSNCLQIFEVAKELKPELAKKLMTRQELDAELAKRRREIEKAAPHCRYCNSHLAKGMVYCPQCGQKI